MTRPPFALALSLWILTSLLSACALTASPTPLTVPMTPVLALETTPAVQASAQPTGASPSPSSTAQIAPTASLAPSRTPAPAATSTPTPSPTKTPPACDMRVPDDGLFTLVTRDFGLSRDYAPSDLVSLSDYFGMDVTLGYPTEVRAVIVEPLQRIVKAMQANELAPQIVSGYRSYSAQSLAFQKWLLEYPEWGSNLSAPPGHSEHQLGTTVDFGSPELKWMLGDNYVQFHPAFADTSVGQWLATHAPDYGFTMSYPEDAVERTTFLYEPWHFRYVGPELAELLASDDLTISEYLEREKPEPCIADQ